MEENIRSFSFVVPCLNEEENVGATVREITSAIGGKHSYEILLVDDCSSDQTLQRMKELAEVDRHVRVFHNEHNLGLGASYKRGLCEAQMNYIMLVPGDNGFPSASIQAILARTGQADIIIPYVINAGVRNVSRVLISRLFTVLLNALFRLDVRYYNGTVLHKTAVLKTVTITTDSFAYQAEALVKLIVKGTSYIQCPVTIRDRTVGRSSAFKAKNAFSVIRTIFHLAYNVGVFRTIKS
jgi:glycosyltransferase involved in cell wall biosynthesis